MQPSAVLERDTGSHGLSLRPHGKLEGKPVGRLVSFQHHVATAAVDRVHQDLLVDPDFASQFRTGDHVGPDQSEQAFIGRKGQVAIAPERYALVGVQAADHGHWLTPRAMHPEADGLVGTVDEAVEYPVGHERQENEGPQQFKHAVVAPFAVPVEQFQAVHLFDGPVGPGTPARGMRRDGHATRFGDFLDERGQPQGTVLIHIPAHTEGEQVARAGIDLFAHQQQQPVMVSLVAVEQGLHRIVIGQDEEIRSRVLPRPDDIRDRPAAVGVRGMDVDGAGIARR